MTEDWRICPSHGLPMDQPLLLDLRCGRWMCLRCRTGYMETRLPEWWRVVEQYWEDKKPPAD